MEYYAHTREGGGRQLLCEHLQATAELCASFAFPELQACARLTGLLHDLGKYQAAFQRRLENGGCGAPAPHALCGAQEARTYFGGKLCWEIFGYLAAGHHAGLSDRGVDGGETQAGELYNYVTCQCGDYSAWKSEISLPAPESVMREIGDFLREFTYESYSFFIRYLFSCLTDADFLDTERFVRGEGRRAFFADWTACASALEAHLRALGGKAENALQRARAQLQQQALAQADVASPVYLLDMPTGSGKTLCSLAFALERARRTGKKRIIYIIPYTSIVEQTADLFEKILPPEVPVLRHDGIVDYDAYSVRAEGDAAADEGGCDAAEACKKATENWDMPVIVTTNVQFFESIYSNRSGKLRKLHNMAESILVFDEVHTLPIRWFIPCMQAVEQLTAHYRSEALFLTATMPDFAALTARNLGHALPVFDLLPEKSLYPCFDKCTFEDAGTLGTEALMARLDGTKSVLVVCNRKRTAEEYFRASAAEHKFCLSTYLTPRHRSARIAEIASLLARGVPVAVFATSLIEAGVDLDFACVYREMAGIDSLLQAAGRCNRSGRAAKEESKVYLFRSEHPPRGELQLRANIAEGILKRYGADRLSDAACVKEYFDALYLTERQKMKSPQRERNPLVVDFREIAKEFRFIESTSVGIVIPDAENEAELAALRAGYGDRRKLRAYSATVSPYELNALHESGVLFEYDGVFVLGRADLYNEQTGLCVQAPSGEAEFY